MAQSESRQSWQNLMTHRRLILILNSRAARPQVVKLSRARHSSPGVKLQHTPRRHFYLRGPERIYQRINNRRRQINYLEAINTPETLFAQINRWVIRGFGIAAALCIYLGWKKSRPPRFAFDTFGATTWYTRRLVHTKSYGHFQRHIYTVCSIMGARWCLF